MSTPKLFYVSGPITGTTDHAKRFAAGCREVLELGHIPVDPQLGCPTDLDWVGYMKRDIRILLNTDGLYALRGWENSRGARLEHLIATALDMTVIYQPDEEDQ